MAAPTDSIELVVHAFDYRENPATRRLHTVASPTAAQRALWLKGSGGTSAGPNTTQRGAQASKPRDYGW